MTTAYTGNGSTAGSVLHLAFELGWTQWKLAFTVGHGQKPRQRTIRGRDGVIKEGGRCGEQYEQHGVTGDDPRPLPFTVLRHWASPP